jgi:hypothetical protein
VRNGVKRTLRERGERSDLLDVVTEELDAQRLATGTREHVDEPAADRDLPALLDALDALVPGKRELLDEGVEVSRVLGRQTDRVGSLLRRRQALCERAGRDAHEPAGREHLESTGPLADEMRRGLQTRARADAAAREQRDGSGIDVPADRLGDVACLLVLREQACDRPRKRRVERRED